MAGDAPGSSAGRAWRLGASRQPRRDALSFVERKSPQVPTRTIFLVVPTTPGRRIVHGAGRAVRPRERCPTIPGGRTPAIPWVSALSVAAWAWWPAAFLLP